MKTKTLYLFLIISFISCEGTKEEKPTNVEKKEVAFNSKGWKEKDDDEYPLRSLMYEEILYSDSVRTLTKSEILKMLGDPDKEEINHLYYTVDRNSLGSWTLNQKSLVFKFRKNDSVEWIKLHE